MEGTPRTRRSALGTLIAAAAGVVAFVRYLAPRAGAPPSRRFSVPRADVPTGGALVLPDEGAAVLADAQGRLRALDLTCPHLACTVRGTESGFACPCHGSRFDSQGRNVTGPATRPLAELRLEAEGDTVTVFLGDERGPRADGDARRPSPARRPVA